MADLTVSLRTPNGFELALPSGLFINNEFVLSSPGRMIEIVDWSDETVIASGQAASADDIDRAVRAARAAFEADKWQGISNTERGILLLKLADLIDDDCKLLASIEAVVNGKPYEVALNDDLSETVATFRYYAGWADKIHGSTIPTTPTKLACTIKQPVGVCGQIIPWNFPVMMAGWKLGPALACGNTVVFKPAEQTLLSILYLAKLIKQATSPPGSREYLELVRKRGRSSTSRTSRCYKVAFTGSTATARIVMKNAGVNLKSLILESGGKPPLLVFRDADVDQAVKWGYSGVMYDQGQ